MNGYENQNCFVWTDPDGTINQASSASPPPNPTRHPPVAYFNFEYTVFSDKIKHPKFFKRLNTWSNQTLKHAIL